MTQKDNSSPCGTHVTVPQCGGEDLLLLPVPLQSYTVKPCYLGLPDGQRGKEYAW